MDNLHTTPGVATITAVMVLARIELIFFAVVREDYASDSWGWLNTHMSMESGEWIAFLFFFVSACRFFSLCKTLFTIMKGFSHFYPSDCFHHFTGEQWASPLGLSGWQGLNHNNSSVVCFQDIREGQLLSSIAAKTPKALNVEMVSSAAVSCLCCTKT